MLEGLKSNNFGHDSFEFWKIQSSMALSAWDRAEWVGTERSGVGWNREEWGGTERSQVG